MEKGDERKGRENEKRSNDNKNKNKKMCPEGEGSSKLTACPTVLNLLS